MLEKMISVIVPVYCEESVILECYNRLEENLNNLKDYKYEIIFVDDGSKDKSFSILSDLAKEDKNIKIISFARNFGHQNAVMAGLRNVSGDCVLIMDADLQDPPELIDDMLKYWEKGYEVVYGKRRKRDGESFFKLFTAKMFYKLLNAFSDVEIPRDTGDFRLVDRTVVDTINAMPEHNKFLRGLFSWVGYNQYAFEYDRKERVAGKTKYPLRKMIKLAGDGIISFSSKPIKIVGTLGIFSIMISFAILLYSLIQFGRGEAITPGWTSIMVTITFFTGIQLISLWGISEYIGRIYDESKKRPEYIIRKKINFDE